MTYHNILFGMSQVLLLTGCWWLHPGLALIVAGGMFFWLAICAYAQHLDTTGATAGEG